MKFKIKDDKKILLIPSMLDFHFPLLQYAFYSKYYNPVILNNDKDIAKIGLQYAHNDLCYPAILIIGQMIGALQSNEYDIDRVVLLIPQAGDACRGSNYIHMIHKALIKAGYEKVPIVSLNFKGLENDYHFKVSISMVKRAIASIIFSDLLMILKNQIEPYEKNQGETKNCIDKWISCIGQDMINTNKLSYFYIKSTLQKITEDFQNIERKKNNTVKIGIVGELYIKYCHLGNGNLENFLKDQSCEYMVNGFSWYILYYIDTHLTNDNTIMDNLYKLALKYFSGLQRLMIDTIKKAGFYCIDEYKEFKENAKDKSPFGIKVADGWLISCEIVNLIKLGYKKILCIQPFGCMPNHICGKGLYSSLQRKYTDVQIVSVDYDSSGSEINIRNRVKMLLDL